MRQSRRDRRDWRVFLWVSVVSAIVSAYFGVQVMPLRSTVPLGIFIGVLTSLLIATPLTWLELRGERTEVMRRLRRLPLALYFAVKVVIYLVVIVTGLLIQRLITMPLTDMPIVFDDEFRQSMVFAVIMSVAVNLVFEIGFLLGFGTLKNLLIGRYVQPKREQRVFLLMDMRDSTGVAERLGPVLFHELLNDFFRDIAYAAIECEAEIYKYVGDEAILTWTSEQAVADGACLACPFLVRDRIEANRRHYLDRYGLVPAFRAALHYGEIVTGEIGDLRREIAYVGDTLNVAARLLDSAKTLEKDVLVSNDLLDHSQLPAELAAEPLPTLTVRGRVAPLGISALEPAPA
ncbi:MAG: adenylate/guanylate cyclase domain-containing protein [Alphaproteobacteria bacterium]|nr:adenylate/guanylate cyclase domain-containing protein [Alphaproteobacteria bacterium]